jgi:hypothetical protein
MATTGLAALRRYAKSLTSMRSAHLKGAENITMIGIDFSKNAFRLVGSDNRVSGSAAGDYFGCRLIEMT